MILASKPARDLTLFALTAIAISMAAAATAQDEVAKGSALRKELFELARPKIEKMSGQAVRFQGSMKQLDDWVFFIGSIVDADGATIQIGPAESGDTAILWTNRNGKWVVIEAQTGFTDVIYLEWPGKHGFPQALIGS